MAEVAYYVALPFVASDDGVALGATAKIGDVYLLKLLAEDIFRDFNIPKTAEQQTVEVGRRE